MVASKGTIVLADTQTGKLLHGSKHTCHAAWCPIHAAKFSPDGLHVVLGSADKTACVVDSRTGLKTFTIEGLHTGAILDACFSPDGARVVLASADMTASIVDAHTGDLQLHIKGLHTAAINAARFSPDSSRLVLASADKTASVLDASTGDRLVHLQDIHDNAILAADFSPHGTWLVLGCADGSASVIDAKGGTAYWNHNFQASHKTGKIHAAHFSPDGQHILLGCEGKKALIVDGNNPSKVINDLGGVHKGAVFTAFFSSDARRVIMGSADRSVSVTTLRVRTVPYTLHQHTGFDPSYALHTFHAFTMVRRATATRVTTGKFVLPKFLACHSAA